MVDPQQLNVEINILVGLLSMLYPELVNRATPDQLRRMALECRDEVRAERSIPAPFLRAFER